MRGAESASLPGAGEFIRNFFRSLFRVFSFLFFSSSFLFFFRFSSSSLLFVSPSFSSSLFLFLFLSFFFFCHVRTIPKESSSPVTRREPPLPFVSFNVCRRKKRQRYAVLRNFSFPSSSPLRFGGRTVKHRLQATTSTVSRRSPIRSIYPRAS